jgi:hypothetical protein
MSNPTEAAPQPLALGKIDLLFRALGRPPAIDPTLERSQVAGLEPASELLEEVIEKGFGFQFRRVP